MTAASSRAIISGSPTEDLWVWVPSCSKGSPFAFVKNVICQPSPLVFVQKSIESSGLFKAISSCFPMVLGHCGQSFDRLRNNIFPQTFKFRCPTYSFIV